MANHSLSWLSIYAQATARIGFGTLIPSATFTGLAMATVSMRWYSRAYLSRRVGTGDVLVTAAMLLSMGMAATTLAEYLLNVPEMIDQMNMAERLGKMMKLIFAHSIVFHLAINLVKVSILLEYVQIFSSIRPMVYVCYGLLATVLSAVCWAVFGVVFLCIPIRKYWDPLEVPGKCMDPLLHFNSTAIWGIVLDFVIWILPMTVIGRLKLERRQKYGLFFVFGLGGFVCIVSILRLILVQNAVRNGDVSRAYATIWSTIELNVAIICNCLLVMKPLMVWFLRPLISLTSAQDDEKYINGRIPDLGSINSGYNSEATKCASPTRIQLMKTNSTIIDFGTLPNVRNRRSSAPPLQIERADFGLGAQSCAQDSGLVRRATESHSSSSAGLLSPPPPWSPEDDSGGLWPNTCVSLEQEDFNRL